MENGVASKVILSLILVICLMILSTGGSTGSRPVMDTDLGISSASFLGDDTNDLFGSSIASAGDVNGDGYDDILVGAPRNGDGGLVAGHTYLYFGRSSGWYMDIKPLMANASFRGEDAGDMSGQSVAGAGDVNGDGYDDILIGAYGDDDGGNSAGQSYLIFGRATGWSRNTDLSSANASFWGEEADDRAGYSVAGAGDVNGDGYDDILIGAFENDEGQGNNAGQTYLIFGKATGWAMDTDLSLANASFWGENGNDVSGRSVAGAGDVNDDGYDDILIGAHYNADEDDLAGQTYLVLGMATGWSMDTNLSNANASFWGEDYNDRAGTSVAGVGDVNGDGFDDFMIGAPTDDDGGPSAGQAYLVFGKASGWSMDTSLGNANASFWGENQNDWAGLSIAGTGDVNNDGFDDILVGAIANSDGGDNAGQAYLIFGNATGWAMDTDLSTVDVSFIGEKAGDAAGNSVAAAGDVNGDGYDDILIGAKRNDDEDNNAGQAYLVFFDDGAPPEIQLDMTPTNATTGDPFVFNVSVTDRSGINNVTIEFWYGTSGIHFNLSAFMTTGDLANGTWALSITVPSDSIETIHYIVHVTDIAYYLVSSDRKDVPVLDDDPPVLVNDLTPSNATTGDPFTFKTNAWDNIMVASIYLEYWYENSSVHPWESIPSEDFEYTIDIRNTLEPIHYYFLVRDSSGNLNISANVTVSILDNDLPVINRDTSDSNAVTGENFSFKISVKDNIEVSEVHLVYWFGSGVEENVSMVNEAYSRWVHNITVPIDSIGPLHYRIEFADSSWNWNISLMTTVDVLDPYYPYFGEDMTPSSGTTGDAFNFTIMVMDNGGIDELWVTYWYGVGETINRSLSQESGNIWVGTITIENTLEHLNYLFTTTDSYGNGNNTSVRRIEIIDNDEPEIVNDASSTSATTGEDFKFDVTVSDNINIGQARVEFFFSDGVPVLMEMANDGGDLNAFTQTIGIPTTANGPLTYRFIVTDHVGNILKGEAMEVPVVDNILPEIQDITWIDPIKGLGLLVVLKANDNLGVIHANITYWYSGGPMTTVEMAENLEATILIPREITGLFQFTITVSDGAGNQVTSDKVELIPVNADPVVGRVPVWSILEESESWLDLEPFLSDMNDDISSLIIESSDANVTVVGLKLRATYHVAVPDHSLGFTVSDGEGTASGEVVVHIENINDAPVIVTILPANDSYYRAGKKVNFIIDAIDEEGDDLTITWMTGETTMGTGTTLDYKKLKPGTRVVRVIVSDGEDTTEGEITLIIKEGEESPGVGIVVSIAAILLAGLAALFRPDRKDVL